MTSEVANVILNAEDDIPASRSPSSHSLGVCNSDWRSWSGFGVGAVFEEHDGRLVELRAGEALGKPQPREFRLRSKSSAASILTSPFLPSSLPSSSADRAAQFPPACPSLFRGSGRKLSDVPLSASPTCARNAGNGTTFPLVWP